MLPENGPISWDDIARELVWPKGQPLSLNAPEIYALVGKTPGSIIHFPDDFYGKAFLDIIPDRIAWDNVEGGQYAMGVNRAFSGLGVGIEIILGFSIDIHSATEAYFHIYVDDAFISETAIRNGVVGKIPSITVRNGTKIKFAVRNDTQNPLNATLTIRNDSFYGETLDDVELRINGIAS